MPQTFTYQLTECHMDEKYNNETRMAIHNNSSYWILQFYYIYRIAGNEWKWLNGT